MVKEMTEKHERDIVERHKHKRAVLEDVIKDRNKKLKELEDKHLKEER